MRQCILFLHLAVYIVWTMSCAPSLHFISNSHLGHWTLISGAQILYNMYNLLSCRITSSWCGLTHFGMAGADGASPVLGVCSSHARGLCATGPWPGPTGAWPSTSGSTSSGSSTVKGGTALSAVASLNLSLSPQSHLVSEGQLGPKINSQKQRLSLIIAKNG